MSRRIHVVYCSLMTVLLITGSADAQPRKMPLIGNLDYLAATDRDEAFFQGLRDLGWIEGRNISIEYRWAEGKLERLPALAKELVRLKVDLIATRGRSGVEAAKSATTTIPIVMVRAADAVENKLIASLARPGGNVTGMSEDHADLHTKLLELLHETLPQAKRVAVLWNPVLCNLHTLFQGGTGRRPGVWGHNSIPGIQSFSGSRIAFRKARECIGSSG